MEKYLLPEFKPSVCELVSNLLLTIGFVIDFFVFCIDR